MTSVETGVADADRISPVECRISAQIVLMLAEGLSTTEVAKGLKTSPPAVRKWRDPYLRKGGRRVGGRPVQDTDRSHVFDITSNLQSTDYSQRATSRRTDRRPNTACQTAQGLKSFDGLLDGCDVVGATGRKEISIIRNLKVSETSCRLAGAMVLAAVVAPWGKLLEYRLKCDDAGWVHPPELRTATADRDGCGFGWMGGSCMWTAPGHPAR